MASAMLILAPSVAQGQTHYKPHLSVGFKAGMTMSEMSFSPSVPDLYHIFICVVNIGFDEKP